MKINWNSKLSSNVSEHIIALQRSDKFACHKDAVIARLTNALPVYFDMSGVLCVNLDGVILFYDTESERMKPITETGWVVLAAVSAAQKYPDLQEMLPTKPCTATSCPGYSEVV